MATTSESRNRPELNVKRIQKAVVLQKPEGWDGSLEAQEILFGVITSRFLWLCIRLEVDEKGLEDSWEKWCRRYPTFLECFWDTLKKAFAECIDNFGYSVRYEPVFDRILQLVQRLFRVKDTRGYETVYELLDYIYILEDTYRVYNYDEK
jgi:hypothetical protein